MYMLKMINLKRKIKQKNQRSDMILQVNGIRILNYLREFLNVAVDNNFVKMKTMNY